MYTKHGMNHNQALASRRASGDGTASGEICTNGHAPADTAPSCAARPEPLDGSMRQFSQKDIDQMTSGSRNSGSGPQYAPIAKLEMVHEGHHMLKSRLCLRLALSGSISRCRKPVPSLPWTRVPGTQGGGQLVSLQIQPQLAGR